MELLSTKGLTKKFGALVANDDINIVLNSGEILSLLGENGAGKTTLMNMLYGLYQPNAGEIFIKGKPVKISSPTDARNRGISMVHQHFMLVENLSVSENVILGKEPILNKVILDLKKANEDVIRLSKEFGFNIDPKKKISQLSVGEKQHVEMIKALYNDVDILILDEPTAVLTPQEVDSFFVVLKKLKAAGKGIILISHKLIETMDIADKIAVLRKGKKVAGLDKIDATIPKLSELMVGYPLKDNSIKRNENFSEKILSLKKLVKGKEEKKEIDSISFDVHRHEIFGIAGVDGNGQSDLIELIMGLSKQDDGSIEYLGKSLNDLTVKERLNEGIGYIPEDRNKRGFVNSFSILENSLIGFQKRSEYTKKNLLINWKNTKEKVNNYIEGYEIKCKGMKEKTSNLSGGNQQKIIVAKALGNNPTLVLAAQPTRGVDIGAVTYIHKKLVEARDEGKAILLISADLDELMKLSDNIAVIYEGKIVSISKNGVYDKFQLGALMNGANEEEVKNNE